MFFLLMHHHGRNFQWQFTTVHCPLENEIIQHSEKPSIEHIIRSANSPNQTTWFRINVAAECRPFVNFSKANTAEEVGNPRMTDFLIFIRVYLQK